MFRALICFFAFSTLLSGLVFAVSSDDRLAVDHVGNLFSCGTRGIRGHVFVFAEEKVSLLLF